jgi:hypothetical protein
MKIKYNALSDKCNNRNLNYLLTPLSHFNKIQNLNLGQGLILKRIKKYKNSKNLKKYSNKNKSKMIAFQKNT